MANAENLKKGKATQFKSGKDAVENGRKAGVALRASRRRKRAMRQAAAMLLNTQIPMNERGPFMGTVKTLLKTFGYTPDDATYQDALLAGIMLEAMKGDVRAAEFIRDTAGESPALDIRKAELKMRQEELKFKQEQSSGAAAPGAVNNLLEAIMQTGRLTRMIYRRLSKRQKLAMLWWQQPRFRGQDVLLCDGSIRSGKTVCMTVGFIPLEHGDFQRGAVRAVRQDHREPAAQCGS